MPQFIPILKEEIRRLAKQEIKKANQPLRKDVVRLKRDNAALKRQVTKLGRDNKFLLVNERRRAQTTMPVAPEEIKKFRIKAKTIVTLRKKLGLSQSDLARLLQVSAVAIGQWEHKPGMLRLRPKALAAYAKIKDLGAREAKRFLAELPAKPAKTPNKIGAKKAGKKAVNSKKPAKGIKKAVKNTQPAASTVAVKASVKSLKKAPVKRGKK